MAMFSSRQSNDVDPFTDLLFNALLTFTFLFLISLLLLNPPAKSGIIDPKAEFMVTVSWPDNSPDDIDVWVEGPKNKTVWYRQPQSGLMHLDRDDRGMVNDQQVINGQAIVNPLNQEIVTIRGRPPGEYTVNVHYYNSQTFESVPVTVYVAEVNPRLRVLHYATTTLDRQGDERTAVRFNIGADGEVGDINDLQKSIVEGNK